MPIWRNDLIAYCQKKARKHYINKRLDLWAIWVQRLGLYEDRQKEWEERKK